MPAQNFRCNQSELIRDAIVDKSCKRLLTQQIVVSVLSILKWCFIKVQACYSKGHFLCEFD